eukprot:scaffold13647_cov112-Isochrysis_galbana.AAC.6
MYNVIYLARRSQLSHPQAVCYCDANTWDCVRLENTYTHIPSGSGDLDLGLGGLAAGREP